MERCGAIYVKRGTDLEAVLKRLKNEAGRLILFVVLVALDQWTKWLAFSRLKGQPSFPVIEGILEFEYVENTGAAFGSLQNMNGVLLVTGILLFGFLMYVYTAIPQDKKWNKLKYAGAVLLAGAIGNLFDRVIYGFVVDFIYFKPINFPRFNLADSYITVSLVVICIFMFLVYKDEDLQQISLKSSARKKTGD